jgi:HTH-type transcriptional regulator/antitoxin HigA
LRPLRTDRDHAAAIREIERLWAAKPGTADHDRLEILGTLVDAYESLRWPIDLPDPIEAIRFHMEQRGLTQADLAALLGAASRASEILRRRRRLTLDMAWKLHRTWGIPAESLLQPYKLAA